MRHQNRIKKLGRTHAHRKATLAALSNALIEHKKITTTLAKAKALRGYIEPLLNRAKEDSTHNRREIFRHLQNKESIKILFGEIAGRISERNGGYTRVVKLGQRPGDGAETAVIELVDYNVTGPATGTGGRRRRTRRGPRRKGEGEPQAAQPAAKPAAPAPAPPPAETPEPATEEATETPERAAETPQAAAAEPAQEPAAPAEPGEEAGTEGAAEDETPKA